MLYIDTREKGSLPNKLSQVENSVVCTLMAGDYAITNKKDKDNPILIERSRGGDLLQKIVSGRIDTQIDKCKQSTNNVIILIEELDHKTMARSNMSYKQVIAKIASISQKGVQIIMTRNMSETEVFILKLLDIHTNDATPTTFKRVKPKVFTSKEEAIAALMGIKGIGYKTAKAILKDRSIHHWIHACCLLYTSPSPRDRTRSRMPSSA